MFNFLSEQIRKKLLLERVKHPVHVLTIQAKMKGAKKY